MFDALDWIKGLKRDHSLDQIGRIVKDERNARGPLLRTRIPKPDIQQSVLLQVGGGRAAVSGPFPSFDSIVAGELIRASSPWWDAASVC